MASSRLLKNPNGGRMWLVLGSWHRSSMSRSADHGRWNRGVEGSFSLLQADSPCRQQLGDADQVVGGGGEDEEPFDQAAAAMTGLAQAADGLDPAERFLDPLVGA